MTQKTCTNSTCPERKGGECTAGLTALETLQGEMREKFEGMRQYLHLDEKRPCIDHEYASQVAHSLIVKAHTLGKKAGYEAGYVEGQKHAFGVDRERVKQEGEKML